MLIDKTIRHAARLLMLAVIFVSTPSYATQEITEACAVVKKQSCGDCDLDTPALRGALTILKSEKAKFSPGDVALLKTDLCLLTGLHSLAAIHLTQPNAKSLATERNQLEQSIKSEQVRLLRQYPKNKEVLTTVLSTGSLPDELAFRAYSALAEVDKSNAEAAFWAGFYALTVSDGTWRVRVSGAMKRVTNAQLFRQFVDVLSDAIRNGQCSEKSVKIVAVLRDNVESAWQGVDADIEVMTPKMLKLSAKFGDDVLALQCESTRPPK